jgi:hypothetical protein
VNFKDIFNHKDQRDFPMPCKEVHILVYGLKYIFFKTDIEYPFEYVVVIKSHFRCCINTTSHYKDTGVHLNSVAREEGNQSRISPCDFKTVRVEWL